jgi:endoglucanase
LNETQVAADFRGSVDPAYFIGTKVRLHRDGARPALGAIESIESKSDSRLDHEVVVEFARNVETDPGDVMTWALPPSRISDDRLRTPACDNLAGVAAALATLDRLGQSAATKKLDVRVLLTRSEEVGFVGAIGAATGGFVPKDATIVVLETSRSFADSPIGAGPIVRVGDKVNCFHPETTYMLSEVAKALEERNANFRGQRKLMPGGTCNASAYQSYGFATGCLCLALGNYHNMNEAKRRIDREVISISDWHMLVRLLVEVARVHSVSTCSQSTTEDPCFPTTTEGRDALPGAQMLRRASNPCANPGSVIRLRWAVTAFQRPRYVA